MSDFFEKLVNYLKTDGVTLAKSITLILIGYMIIRVINKALKYSVNKSNLREKTLANFLISLLNIVLMLVLIIAVLTLFGVSPDSVVTIASVFSLGISLALQDTISSLANGIIIIISKPFIEGEYIWVNEEEGTVVSISMFHTTLLTPKGQMITIPNSSAAASNVINYSRLPTRRIDIQVPVTYRSDVEKVKSTIMEVVKTQKGILKNPEASVRLTEYGNSNLVYTLKCWVPSGIYWDTIFDLNEKILIALGKAGISIDYEQYDVRIKELPISKKGE